MPDFTATWNINVFDAATPTDAARKAWSQMRKPDSTANVFDIADETGNITHIDLQELDEEDDFDEEPCRLCGAVPGTPEYGTVGDGYDGMCPSCADAEEPKEFSVRLAVTVRAYADTTIEALSWEDAVEKAKAIQPREYIFRYDHEDIEGDPIAYLGEGDEYPEHEVDIREEGEPFSWTAVDIVKALAKLAGQPDAIKALEADALIERAKTACTKDA